MRNLSEKWNEGIRKVKRLNAAERQMKPKTQNKDDTCYEVDEIAASRTYGAKLEK
jgi:hypothetical protein